jgi:hypothetical protein
MSFTWRLPGKPGDGGAEFGAVKFGLLIRQPERHRAAPDMNPFLMNMRRESFNGE